MRRFTKVASLLAAMSVLACSAAFAADPYYPGALVGTTDVRLLASGDAGATNSQPFSTIVSPDHDAAGTALKSFIVSASDDITLSNDHGLFALPEGGYYLGTSFDKLLVRTTADTFTMTFVVSNDNHGTASKDLVLGLRGGYEYNVPAAEKNLLGLASNCTLACTNFYHSMNHSDPLSADQTAFTMTDTVKWIGTGATAYYVECCDHFGLAASTDLSGLSPISSDSRDMVVAHLSTTPFLRVRIASADQVLSDDSKYVEAKSDDLKDFRAPYWRHKDLQTGAVDVPDGKTFNMGVLYADSSDCLVCGTPTCDNGYLPVVAVTNLGDKAVDIVANYGSASVLDVASWLCNSWCGLCEFDDMMSGDQGSLGDGLFTTIATVKAQSALGDCVCHIYPAFTNTFKGKGNVDIAWTGKSASATTTIAGRVNTSWAKANLSSGGLCASCVEEASFYYPCNCLETYYIDTIGAQLRFAHDGDLKVVSYNNNDSTVAGDYERVEVVFGLNANKSADILLTKLAWNLESSALSDAGLLNLSSGQWWRGELWNKMAIKLNGITLDSSNVQSVAGADTFSSDELSFLTIVDGPQAPAPDFKLGATDTAEVSLFVFVMDSDDNAVRYYKDAVTGNQFLVVYDGKKDGEFKLEGIIAKKSGDTPVSADFGLSASALELNIGVDADKAKTLSAKNAPAGAVVVWSVVSSDIATLSATSGDSITVTGVATGSTTVHAAISGDENVSADCTVTVKNEPVHSSSSGGCNVGFAPALLLLLAPLAFLKK